MPLIVRLFQEMPRLLGLSSVSDSSCSSLRISLVKCHSDFSVGLSVLAAFSEFGSSMIVVEEAARLPASSVRLGSGMLERVTKVTKSASVQRASGYIKRRKQQQEREDFCQRHAICDTCESENPPTSTTTVAFGSAIARLASITSGR